MTKSKKQKEKETWDKITSTLMIAGFIIIGLVLTRVPILLGIYLIVVAVLFNEASKKDVK